VIAVDGTPLMLEPHGGVARALTELLAGWARLAPDEPPVVLKPAAGESARAFRKRLPKLVKDDRFEALYSPWSAFPRLDVPVVVLVHELPFVRHGMLEGRLRAVRHRRWLRRNVRACAGIVVPSEATRRDLLTLHPEAEARVHVIPNGFDPAPWSVPRAAPASPPRVLMVGMGHGPRGARKKGLDVLAEAWQRCRPHAWRLDLVGEAGADAPAGARPHASLDDASLRSLLARATALVYPSRAEGFGYPPLEAMAAGVPVLTTDAGSIPQVVGDAALVVPAGDAEALAAGLRRLLDEEALRARLTAAGLQRCRAFDSRETARGIRSVFERLGVTA